MAEYHHRDDGGSKLLWNVGQYLRSHIAQHPPSYLLPWKPEISPILLFAYTIAVETKVKGGKEQGKCGQIQNECLL
jgi:hypothetical protein